MEDSALHACSHCNRVFKKFYFLSRHIYQYHIKPTCTACNNSFGRMKELKEHAVHTHELKMNKLCSLCKKAYSTRQDLENHLKDDHSKELPLICLKCPRMFSDEERLKTHMMNHSRRKSSFRCLQCDSTFTTQYNLNKHRRAVHDGNNTLKCPECGVIFPADEDVRKRICELHLEAASKVQEEVEEEPYICKYCEKPFATHRLRNQHIRAEHLDKRPVKCSRCSFSFETEEEAEKHFVGRHTRRKRNSEMNQEGAPKIQDGVEEESYFCKYCEKPFATPRLRNQHVRAEHLDKRPFKCSRCSFSFETEEEVEKHFMGRHTRRTRNSEMQDGVEESYFCKYCEKSFANPRVGNQHIRAEHADKRPFKCSSCPFIFETEEEVENHFMRRHARRTFRRSSGPGRRLKDDLEVKQGDSDQDGGHQQKATTNGLSDMSKTQNGQED